MDSEGKCIYTKARAENPLPIEEIRKAVKDVEEGRFIPDREDDELTRALGNPEHEGRTRDTEGSKPWTLGFPAERKKFPDKSHQRRKERVEMEEKNKADRLCQIEEQLKLQYDHINALIQQGSGPSQAAFDVAAPSNRKSGVASTEQPVDDDDAPMMGHLRYPVVDITEMTRCELNVKVVNIPIKVAVGYALPPGLKPTFHCRPIPHGYAIIGVDKVMIGFDELKLDHPAGEDGDVTELGEAKNVTILWRKECIVFPSSNTSQHSLTPHPSPPQQSPHPHPSPVQQSTPPHPSPPQRSFSPQRR